ncbi:ATP-binding protein [Deinococcus detaillensis]|nr:BTAD domain-containing putative transcriptional regulator [Deinococcus detaillensis]
MAYLALQQVWVPRAQLQTLLWPDCPAPLIQNRFRQLLSRIRKLTQLPPLEIERIRLRWHIRTDMSEFEEAVHQGRWQEALDHYGGPFLEGMDADGEYSSWLERERARLAGLCRVAVIKRAEQFGQQGAHLAAADLLSPLLDGDELDEEALSLQVDAFLQAGGHQRALQACRSFVERLDYEYHLAPSAELAALQQRIQSGPQNTSEQLWMRASTPAATTFRFPDLPMRPGPCIGRDMEIAEITVYLSRPECRMLTLTGPGGIGKTRLALEAAHLAAEEASECVCFVRLEALTTSAQIVPAVAEALRLPLAGPADAAEQVTRVFADNQTLLVLDNFEHLLDGAGVVLTLLQACPRLRLLITSRESLDLEPEWLVPINGLDCPDAGTTDHTTGQYYDAVLMFLDRARRTWPAFAPGPAEFPHLATICQLVGGSPLGLELAAAWVRFLPLHEIVVELQQNLDFLDSARRGVNERHRSLRGVFTHSWRLLSPAQQQVLCHLSVFRAGFRLPGARQVATASAKVLADLVSKSLVQLGPDGRYQVHTLIRQYLAEHLQASPEDWRRVHNLHSDHYFSLLFKEGKTVEERGEPYTLGALDEELENLRAAWSWALTAGSPGELRPSLTRWAQFCEWQAGFQEGVRSFTEAVHLLTRRGHDVQEVLGDALMQQAWFTLHQGQTVAAQALALQGLAFTAPGDQTPMSAHRVLGIVDHAIGQYEESATHYRRAAELASAPALASQRAAFLTNLSGEVAALGRYDEARKYVVEAQKLYRTLDMKAGLASTLAMQGHLATLAGQLDQAQAVLEEGLTLARKYDGYVRVLHVLHCLAEVAFCRSDYAQARRLCEEQLALVQSQDNEVFSVAALLLLSRISGALRADLKARAFFDRGLRLALSSGKWPRVLEGLVYLAEWRVNQGQPLEAVLYCRAALDHPATEDRFRRLAAHLLASIEDYEVAQTPSETRVTTQVLTLESLIAQALFHLGQTTS